MITIKQKGDFKNTEKLLSRATRINLRNILNRYGEMGVNALAAATPIDTGKTASSWGYRLEIGNESSTIVWTNSNVNKGVNIAIILQYGHGTRNGGYVKGRDYINPAMKPIFDDLASEAWKEVTGS